jgi:hypothetical protein
MVKNKMLKLNLALLVLETPLQLPRAIPWQQLAGWAHFITECPSIHKYSFLPSLASYILYVRSPMEQC